MGEPCAPLKHVVCLRSTGARLLPRSRAQATQRNGGDPEIGRDVVAPQAWEERLVSLAEAREALGGAQGQELVCPELAFEESVLREATPDDLPTDISFVERFQLGPRKNEELARLERLHAQVRRSTGEERGVRADDLTWTGERPHHRPATRGHVDLAQEAADHETDRIGDLPRARQELAGRELHGSESLVQTPPLLVRDRGESTKERQDVGVGAREILIPGKRHDPSFRRDSPDVDVYAGRQGGRLG